MNVESQRAVPHGYRDTLYRTFGEMCQERPLVTANDFINAWGKLYIPKSCFFPPPYLVQAHARNILAAQFALSQSETMRLLPDSDTINNHFVSQDRVLTLTRRFAGYFFEKWDSLISQL